MAETKKKAVTGSHKKQPVIAAVIVPSIVDFEKNL